MYFMVPSFVSAIAAQPPLFRKAEQVHHSEVEHISLGSLANARVGRGRVARPFGFALTDPGRRLSRTRLFPEVTRIEPSLASKDG